MTSKILLFCFYVWIATTCLVQLVYEFLGKSDDFGKAALAALVVVVIAMLTSATGDAPGEGRGYWIGLSVGWTCATIFNIAALSTAVPFTWHLVVGGIAMATLGVTVMLFVGRTVHRSRQNQH